MQKSPGAIFATILFSAAVIKTLALPEVSPAAKSERIS